MYLEHWKLQKAPFANVPNRTVFFRSPQHEEALHRLLYVVEHRKGVAMLTGEVGSGKTTVAKVLINYLDKNKYQLYMLSNPPQEPNDLIKSILLKLGGRSDNGSKTVLLDELNKLLFQNFKSGINTILAIDEAHVIDNRTTLDELRMLLNIQSDNEFLITLVLVGQPPLLRNISELPSLKERISIKFSLEPLDDQNTMRYVMHRLEWAGATRGIFSRKAIETLHQYTGGLPLRINNLCDRCLLIGFIRQARMVNNKIANDAIGDLES